MANDPFLNNKDKPIFKDGADYWQVAENIRDIYMSEGSLSTLLDFERVLDELDLYAFKNCLITMHLTTTVGIFASRRASVARNLMYLYTNS